MSRKASHFEPLQAVAMTILPMLLVILDVVCTSSTGPA